MSWKQPIPTDLIKLTQGHKFASTVFTLLLLRAANKDMTYYLDGQPIELKRGQCVCGRFELAEYLGVNARGSLRVQRILKKLENLYKLVNIQKSRNCSIVTILNYDDLVSIEQSNDLAMNNQRTINEQSTNTNKSVYNIKQLESVEGAKNFPKTFFQMEVEQKAFLRAKNILDGMNEDLARGEITQEEYDQFMKKYNINYYKENNLL